MKQLFNFLSYGTVALLAVWSALTFHDLVTNTQQKQQAQAISEAEIARAELYFSHPQSRAIVPSMNMHSGAALLDALSNKIKMDAAIAAERFDDKLYLPGQIMKEVEDEARFVIKDKDGEDITLNLKKTIAVEGLTLSSELYALLGDYVVGSDTACIYVDQDSPQTLYYSEMITLDLNADEEIYPKSLLWIKVDYDAAQITTHDLVYDAESGHYEIRNQVIENMQDLPVSVMESYSDTWHKSCPDTQMNAKTFFILNGHRVAQYQPPAIKSPDFMPA